MIKVTVERELLIEPVTSGFYYCETQSIVDP